MAVTCRMKRRDNTVCCVNLTVSGQANRINRDATVMTNSSPVSPDLLSPVWCVLCTFRDINHEAFHQIYSKKEIKTKQKIIQIFTHLSS